MRIEQLGQLPIWTYRLMWSAIIILFSWLIGWLIERTVCRKLSHFAAKTSWKWDEIVVDALQRGIPIWSFLFGLRVSAGLWQFPQNILFGINQVVYVLIWLSITFISAGLVGKLVALYGGQFQYAMPMTSLTQNITKAVIIALGTLMILHGLGVSIAPLLTALGVGGLAVALALQDTLSNLFSGFYLTMAKQVRIGDYVKLESGEEGYIDDIGWRATKIRMLPNNIVLVPNNKLSQAIITNYYLPSRELAVSVDVGISYDSDFSHVERVTCEVAREIMRTVQGGVPTFEPFIRYHTLDDFSVNFTVVLRAKEFVDQYLIKHEFIKRLLERYKQEGILIPDSRSRISEQ